MHFQECEAASLYQAGGIAIDLRTDLPYGMEISHDGGGGPDGSFGGKLHVKLYGTVDTSHTEALKFLSFWYCRNAIWTDVSFARKYKCR